MPHGLYGKMQANSLFWFASIGRQCLLRLWATTRGSDHLHIWKLKSVLCKILHKWCTSNMQSFFITIYDPLEVGSGVLCLHFLLHLEHFWAATFRQYVDASSHVCRQPAIRLKGAENVDSAKNSIINLPDWIWGWPSPNQPKLLMQCKMDLGLNIFAILYFSFSFLFLADKRVKSWISCPYREALLHTFVVISDYLSCCLHINPKQSNHSPLTSTSIFIQRIADLCIFYFSDQSL